METPQKPTNAKGPSPKSPEISTGEGPPPRGETHGWAEGNHSSSAKSGTALPGNRRLEAENMGTEGMKLCAGMFKHMKAVGPGGERKPAAISFQKHPEDQPLA